MAKAKPLVPLKPPHPQDENAMALAADSDISLKLSEQIAHIFDKASQYAMGESIHELLPVVLPGLPAGSRIVRRLSNRPSPHPYAPTLLCDAAYELELPGYNFHPVLDAELQSEPHYDEAERGMAYTVGYKRDTKVALEIGGKVYSFTVYLFLTGNVAQVFLEEILPGTRCRILIECDFLCFATLDAADFLAKIEADELSWKLLYWVPLMKKAEEEKIILKWRELAQAHFAPEDLSNLVLVALAFSELAKRDLIWKRHITEYKPMESKVIREMIEEKIKQEVATRLEKEIATRIEQEVATRVTEAVNNSEKRGALISCRDNILHLLTKKFPKEVENLRPTLESQQDPTRLREWFDLVLDARSAKTVRTAFGV